MKRYSMALLALAASCAVMGLGAAPVQADTIKIVVPFAPGGPVDMLARLLAADMGPRLKSEMVVENRGGAGGVLATELVARSAPDGRTLLFASLGSHVISAALRTGLSYDPVKSFAPVAFVGAVPMLVVVSADSPIKSLSDLIAKAKAEKLSYGSAGPGSTMHIIGELMNAGGGMKTAHVPYRGFGPAMNDLLGGHIQFMSADLPVLEPMVKGGKVRALALFATERSPLLPDVPTSVELGYPGMIMGNWYGMLAPTGTPANVQAELEKAMTEAMKSPAIAARLTAGGLRGTTDGKGFTAVLVKDAAYWGPQLKTLGIQGE
jgi:tripartite-type tricarboxylate transporter receptor subunit TctC